MSPWSKFIRGLASILIGGGLWVIPYYLLPEEDQNQIRQPTLTDWIWEFVKIGLLIFAVICIVNLIRGKWRFK